MFDEADARDLCTFIDRSPTPYHAVQEVTRRLTQAGFSELTEEEPWTVAPGDRRFVVRGGGSVIAMLVGSEPPAAAGFRMIGAHTDSPNLRVKPQPDVHRSGYRQVGVEVYGGVIYSTWLDRDLSLAGRVSVAGSGGVTSRLVDLEKPVARVAQLAIHLNRGVNTEGNVLNAQKHLPPLLGVGDIADLVARVARELGESRADVLGFDLMLYDTQKSSLGGLDQELVFAPRLDNLGSCHAATRALLARASKPPARQTAVVVLYDHEECGSRSAIGAQGTFLEATLRRIADGFGDGSTHPFERAMARSFMVSADMAHAVHPNYSDMHEPQHQPELGKGLVVKTNANQSYATTGETQARLAHAVREGGAPLQHFVTRSDLPCGSTIGNITAARLGVATVDVGAPMLSMHSCREMAGSADVAHAIRSFQAVLAGE
jgi:aspartyl aminopeptidase